VNDPKEIERALKMPEFQELWAALMKLCERVRPNNMRVVGAVGRND
jgi:hypothetical protein